MYDLSPEDAANFVFQGEISNKAYSEEQQAINILKKNGKITDVLKESDQLSLKALSTTVTKYYSCYPKEAVWQILLLLHKWNLQRPKLPES